MSNVTVSKLPSMILFEAARLIEQPGRWTVGQYHNQNTDSFCAIGSISKVAGCNFSALGYSGGEASPHYAGAEFSENADAFAAYTAVQEQLKAERGEDSDIDLADFNDRQASARPVADLFRRTAERLMSQGK